MDKYIQEYKYGGSEPRVFYVARWYKQWPAAGEFGYAYAKWGTVAVVPFPLMNVKSAACRETYEALIDCFEPGLIHLGPTYYGDAYISYDFLRKFKGKIVANHAEVGFQGRHMKTFTELPSIVDMVYVCSPTLERELKEITGCTNIRYMPTGTNPEFYYPIDGVDRQIDLLFLGHCGGSKRVRDEVVVKLDRQFDSLWVAGVGWEPHNLRHRFGGAYKHALNEWYSRTKIGLCLLLDAHTRLEEFCTYRLLNIMATRTFALTTYVPGLEKLFTRKVHLDWYTSYEELVDLIHYWLSHDEEREWVARQGYELILEKFTLQQRARQVLRDVGLMP